MDTEISTSEGEGKNIQVKYVGGSSSPVYGLGMIGAWVYYISQAKDFREGMVGFFKGITEKDPVLCLAFRRQRTGLLSNLVSFPS